jgi:hypothetical protein
MKQPLQRLSNIGSQSFATFYTQFLSKAIMINDRSINLEGAACPRVFRLYPFSAPGKTSGHHIYRHCRQIAGMA